MSKQKLGVKLLLTGLSSSGKTNALKSLDPKTSFVVNIDGKQGDLPIPHANFMKFPSVDAFINGYKGTDGIEVDGIMDKLSKFKEKTGVLPETVAIDTVSRVFQIIANNCATQYKGFEIHSNISREIAKFNAFLEETLITHGINVVSLTHVTFNADTGVYEDASSGAYKRSGGSISTHNHVSFLSIKSKKFIITHRSPGLPCRTLLSNDILPDTQPADEYSLAKHLDLLKVVSAAAEKFVL